MMIASMSLLLLGLLSLVTSAGAMFDFESSDRYPDATFRFASYYGNHMVLQQSPARAVVWGYGEVGAQVTVSLVREMDTYVKRTASNMENEGVWNVLLDPMDHGGPYQLVAQQILGKEVNTIYLDDVLFGDVWICGGQSNMEMTVSQVFNASKELAKGSHYPNVRLFTASLVQSSIELQDLAGVDLKWSLPTAENLGHGNFSYFSAVCWLFGRNLAHKLKYPIGLVESCWGGTPVEAWSSKTALSKCGLFHPPVEDSGDHYKYYGPCDYSVLWNAMIHPLLNMTIKGAIWYQGEANTGINTNLYNCTFPALIQDWRRAFHEGSMGQTNPLFPFGFVQLCTNVKSPPKDNYPVIRWHQTADYGYVPNAKMPNTFMAVAMDLGDVKSPYGSVHPRDKQTVGYRLYLGARAIAYGQKSVPFRGPFPVTFDIYYDHMYVNITYDQDLVITRPQSDIFEIFCNTGMDVNGQERRKWIPVYHLLQSSNSKVITVFFRSCPHILGIRYAWSDWPCEYMQCPIYSVRKHLPAPLFVKYFTNGKLKTSLYHTQHVSRDDLL